MSKESDEKLGREIKDLMKKGSEEWIEAEKKKKSKDADDKGSLESLGAKDEDEVIDVLVRRKKKNAPVPNQSQTKEDMDARTDEVILNKWGRVVKVIEKKAKTKEG